MFLINANFINSLLWLYAVGGFCLTSVALAIDGKVSMAYIDDGLLYKTTREHCEDLC